MASDSRQHQPDGIVGPFADMLLAADLPLLPDGRRAEAVQFIQRRVAVIPSLTRFGVAVIGMLFRGLIAVPFGISAARFLSSKPVPVLGEYPRLVRSLGYAYIWDRWPDTMPDGSQR
jgi:hypothetical protein